MICAHSESCFGDLIEQSGYLVWSISLPPKNWWMLKHLFHLRNCRFNFLWKVGSTKWLSHFQRILWFWARSGAGLLFLGTSFLFSLCLRSWTYLEGTNLKFLWQFKCQTFVSGRMEDGRGGGEVDKAHLTSFLEHFWQKDTLAKNILKFSDWANLPFFLWEEA